jgi:F-type H+-transporting ATPase subunit b
MRIDWWTLALQTVNVLILIWILARFFFRPVADIIAKRQEEANKLLSDATAAREAATDARADIDKMRADIAIERDRSIAEARKQVRIEKDNLLAQASQEIAKLRHEAESAIARDRAVAEQAIITHASELAVEIAKRLLGRLPADTILAVFLDGLCRELRALSPEAKGSLTSVAARHPIEVVTATPPSKMEVERIRGALKEVLGSEPPFEFRNDSTLIAGIELHADSIIVRNSWRADLNRIREELDGGKQRRKS